MLPDDEEVQTLGEYLETRMPPKAKEYPGLLTNDFIGVEVELEHCAHMDIAPLRRAGWHISEDGSLRDNGREFKFEHPLCGQAVYDALLVLDNVCSSYAAHGVDYAPRKAVRSSVHVHVDMTDLTSKQLMNVIGLYAAFEIPVFRTFGGDRIQSHFCHPFADCLELNQVFHWLRQGWEVAERQITSPAIGRYCAFNLKSLFKFGTIEFRHHPGEWSREKLLQWINTCLAFKRASGMQIDFVDTFFKSSAVGYADQLQHYMPRDVAARIMEYYQGNAKAMSEDTGVGVRVLQHLVNPRIRIKGN